MGKKRINISISNDKLKDLDWYASLYGINRSRAIEDLISQWNHENYEADGLRTKLNIIKAVMDDLVEEVESCETYEERQSKKCDSFYQLVGCINAVIDTQY